MVTHLNWYFLDAIRCCPGPFPREDLQPKEIHAHIQIRGLKRPLNGFGDACLADAWAAVQYNDGSRCGVNHTNLHAPFGGLMLLVRLPLKQHTAAQRLALAAGRFIACAFVPCVPASLLYYPGDCLGRCVGRN